jgi:hypothetical protein
MRSVVAAVLAALLVGEACSGAVAREGDAAPTSAPAETASREGDGDSGWMWWTVAGLATAAAVTAIVAVVIVRGAESGARGAGRDAGSTDTEAATLPLGTF